MFTWKDTQRKTLILQRNGDVVLPLKVITRRLVVGLVVYSRLQYSIVQYNTVQHSIVLYRKHSIA
jgi:hypothetical protein